MPDTAGHGHGGDVNPPATQGISNRRPRRTRVGEGRARKRNWTLGGLDRERTYWLHWNELERRWDISPRDQVDHDAADGPPPPAPGEVCPSVPS